jgi:hypothetical protein
MFNIKTKTMKKLLICFGCMVIHWSVYGQHQAPANVSSGKNGDPAMPTYFVNGVETPYAKVLKINTSTIESMDVYKGPDAIAKFGKKFKHGVVMVKLKKAKK